MSEILTFFLSINAFILNILTTMNEKHHEVEQWLDSVFGGEPYPSFEVNHVTVEVLWQLMKRSQRQDQATALIIDDLQQKASEYSVQANRISDILEQVGLSQSSLSQSGTVSLNTLVSTALRLHTKDATITNLMLALSDASQERAKVTEARKQEAKLSSQLLAKNRSAYTTYSALQKALSNFEEENKCLGPDLEKKAQEAGFLQSKGKQYRAHLAQLQADLKATGVDSSLHHDTLCRKAEKLQQLRETLHPLRAKLDSYHKLPPDLTLAKVTLEEKRRELEAIEQQLHSQIDLMHM